MATLAGDPGGNRLEGGLFCALTRSLSRSRGLPVPDRTTRSLSGDYARRPWWWFNSGGMLSRRGGGGGGGERSERQQTGGRRWRLARPRQGQQTTPPRAEYDRSAVLVFPWLGSESQRAGVCTARMPRLDDVKNTVVLRRASSVVSRSAMRSITLSVSQQYGPITRQP